MAAMADTLLGSFIWCELMTTDTDAAEAFYKEVVGWTTVDHAPDGSYKIFTTATGVGVAGLMRLPDRGMQDAAPPHWLMYVGTPDIEATAMRIAQYGGRVLKQPATIADGGRFAIVADPHGAAFGIFQPPPNRPGPKRGGVGDFSWFELYTPDPDRAWTFYSTIFGWEKTSAMDMGEMGLYQMFGRGGGVPSGGIMVPPPGAHPAWMPYARVTDAKAAAASATAHGATIVNGPMEVPGGDWIAQGLDPQGAFFSLHSLNPAATAAAPKPTKKKARKAVSKKKPAARAVAKPKATKKKTTKKKASKKPKQAPKKAKKKTAAKAARRKK